MPSCADLFDVAELAGPARFDRSQARVRPRDVAGRPCPPCTGAPQALTLLDAAVAGADAVDAGQLAFTARLVRSSVRAAQPRPEAADADLREALVAGAARDHKRLDSERPDKPLVERLQRALKLGIEPGPGLPALVTGPLLAGVETCWARAARERQRQRFVLAVDKLSVLLEGHQTDASRRLFERAMDADPAAETIARRLIRLPVMHGRPSEAWRVLNLSAAMVELETGLVLAPETRRLAAELGLLPPSFTGMSPDGWSSEAAAAGRR